MRIFIVISSRGRNDGYGRSGGGRDNYQRGGDDRPLRRNADNHAAVPQDGAADDAAAAAPREYEPRMPKYKEPTSAVSLAPLSDK